MWNLDRDKPIPAADILNRAVTEVRRHGRLWVAPPLQCFFSPGMGWLIWSAESTAAGSSPTSGRFIARVGLSNGNAYAWTEQMAQGSVYVAKTNGASSDTQTMPAYELNGQANIQPGTLVDICGAMTLDGTSILVFHHPRHQHTMHLAVDRGRGGESMARTFDFGLRRPGYYFGSEPVTAYLPTLCSYCDTANVAALPPPFGNKTGQPGVDGIYSLTATGVGGAFSLQGTLPDGTPYISANILDGATAAQVVATILASAVTGTFASPVLPNQGIDTVPFLSATGGPLGAAPIILTVHANSWLKILLSGLSVQAPSSGSFDTSAALVALQTPTLDLILDGFYPTRLALSVNGGIGDFALHLGVEQSPFPGPSYATFDYNGNIGLTSWWQTEPKFFQLLGVATVGTSTYEAGTSTIILPSRLQCWPLAIQWNGFTMAQISGPGTDPAVIGPFDATATGVYY